MFTPVFTLLKKDILLELRQQHNLYGIILYIASTVFVLFLSLNDKSIDAAIWNGLFWVIQLFICINAVAKSFLQEGRGKMLYYFTIVSPAHFIMAKILYNVFLMIGMSVISLLLYSVFLTNPISNMLVFIGIVVLGGASISLVFTLMSAIAAKANQNAALIAILGFPIILPLLLMLMQLSKTAFNEIFRQGALLKLTGFIIGLDVLVIALALILFPFLWKD
jgi:heme exporter protein B